ncbi:dicarboxylate/amino acid:cation symporter [Lutispora thermophila]|uniref:Na+/H+-dicarboxylate symporter n=1 Tax=Lutispora thermophila DSM 19022 TaxID=1122184 RepID=A0A1M6BR57_9FIRM|nr:dicarboxylate/amino acid:cation symporter [Lutispora thermophila]SHI51073.1 Na+/H+-dicarboxylate symporter [Lutispora thermophila DSM 19022]
MKKLNLSTKILIALIVGIVVGLLMQGAQDAANNYIKPFGTLFLNLIKLIVVPLVFASLVVGTTGLGDVKKIGKIGGKTLAYYLLTTAFAVIIGLILANVLNVGANYSIPVDATAQAQEIPKFVDTLLNIIPTNPFKALVDGNMLQIIVFAIMLGASIMAIGEKGEPLKKGIDSLAEAMYKMTAAIMNYAPYGVFALIVPVVATNGPSVLLPLLKVIGVVYLGCVLHAVLVYSSTIKAFGKFSPVEFFKKVSPASMFAFTTASSSATLPINMKCAESMGVPNHISSFVLPLGATINMDGTALYQGVCAFFIAQVYGLDLTVSQQITIVLTATLASIGTAGVPGAGLIMLTMVLQAVGLPLEGLALIAGIDRVLDMARTALNVTGDTACAVVIAASENELQRSTASQKNASM